MLDFAAPYSLKCPSLSYSQPSCSIAKRPKEIDEVPSVSLKDIGRQALPLVRGCKDKHIDVTVPERLLVLVPGLDLLSPSPEVTDDLQDTTH